MPIDYDIDDGVLVVHLHGQVTTPEFTSYLAKSEQDPRYSRDMHRLVVLGDDATFPSSQEIIQHAARTPQRKLGPGVRFACVARTPLTIGIASMFMGNAGLGDNYQLFDEEMAAREWLRQGGA